MQFQVHMTIDGPVVLDIVQHFVERWNEVKGRKVRITSHLELSRRPLKCTPHISIRMMCWSLRPSMSLLSS